jgi:hypothetical protein
MAYRLMTSVRDKPPTSISLGKIIENDKRAKNYWPSPCRNILVMCLLIRYTVHHRLMWT